MSNHFGSFWLESYPLFAVYFAAKPPLPRRGLLRFGACAAVYQSLGSDSILLVDCTAHNFFDTKNRFFKKLNRGATCIALLKNPPKSKVGCHFNRLNNQQAAFPRDDDAGGRSSHLRPRDFIDCHQSKQFYVVSLSGNRASLTLISSWTKAPAPFLQRYKHFKLKHGNSLLCCHKKRRKQTMPKCFSNKKSQNQKLVYVHLIHPSKHMLSSVEIMIYS